MTGEALAGPAPEKPEGRVAICIASCRRPAQLRRLLESLDVLAFTGEPPEIEIHLADNDPQGSARAVCEDAQDWLRHPLSYRIEPRPGIPQARNASLAPALGRVEWIAFVDDDEWVDPHWLDALLARQRKSGADVVTGPVLSRFGATAPAWIVEGGFYEAPRFADGSARPTAFTGNTLVRASVLEAQPRWFDERLAIGEDAELFFRLAANGHRIVWADDALAYENVPAERLRLAAILRRGFREGVARARMDLWLSMPGGAAWIALRGAGRLMQGLAGAIRPWPCGAGARARALRRACFGLGRLLGLPGALVSRA